MPAILPAPVRSTALDGGTAQVQALRGGVLAMGTWGSSGYRQYEGTGGVAGSA